MPGGVARVKGYRRTSSEDNFRAGANGLQHDVTHMGSCMVTVILCDY
jgi:hypothetical protein